MSGAITQAIEALDLDNWDWNWLDDDADSLSEQRQILEQALEALKAFRDGVPDLTATLSNAIKPEYYFYATCGNCGAETRTNNGEWLIWCGPETCAEKLLKAAKHLQEGIE